MKNFIIQTVQNIVFTEYVIFINYDETDTSLIATLAGWGAIDAGLGPSIRLRKTDVSLRETNCTSDTYPDFDINYMICGSDGIRVM